MVNSVSVVDMNNSNASKLKASNLFHLYVAYYIHCAFP